MGLRPIGSRNCSLPSVTLVPHSLRPHRGHYGAGGGFLGARTVPLDPCTPNIISPPWRSQQGFRVGGVKVVGWHHLSEDPWGHPGEGQLLRPARVSPRPLSLCELCLHGDSSPTAPTPAPACVNFSNICFPWALVGLGWEGREFWRLPEAALSPFHPCRLSSAEEAISDVPRGSGQQSLPLRPGEQVSPPSPFPWE